MADLDSNELFKIIGGNIKYYRRLYCLRKDKKIDQGISVYTLWKISKALEIPIEKLFDTSDFSERSLDA